MLASDFRECREAGCQAVPASNGMSDAGTGSFPVVSIPARSRWRRCNSESSSGLFLKVIERPVILADVFDDVPIRMQPEAHRRCPRFRVALGIVKGEVHLQGLFVHALDTLGDVHLVAIGMANSIQPQFAI